MSNSILVDTEPGGESQEWLIQLEPHVTLPVRVVEAGGSPLEGMVVYLYGVPKNEAADATIRAHPSTTIRTARPTDGNGRTSLRLELKDAPQLGGEELDRFNFFVTMDLPLAEPPREQVRPSQSGEVVLKMPGSGQVEVEWVGYASNLHPHIAYSPSGNSTSYRPGAARPTSISEDGTLYTFENIPLNAQLEVKVLRHRGSPLLSSRIDGYEGTELAPSPFKGPTQSGETVRIRIENSKLGWISGRLLDENGNPVDGSNDHIEYQFFAYESSGHGNNFQVGVEIEKDGTFIARHTDREATEGTEFHPDAVLIKRQKEVGGGVGGSSEEVEEWLKMRETLVVDSAWCQATLPINNSGHAVELGDLQLHSLPPLVTVEVADEAGQPIQGASISIKSEREWSSGTHTWKRWREQGGHRIATDAKGKAEFQDWSWGHFFFRSISFGPTISIGELERLSAVATHPDFAKQEVEFSPEDRVVRIHVNLSGDLNGSIKRSKKFADLYVGLVQPGEPWVREHQDRNRISETKFNRKSINDQSEGEYEEFALTNIPTGLYDVVFSASHGGGEIFRVSSVHIEVGAQSDPRLTQLDLGPHLGFLELQFILPTGKQLSEQELINLRGCISRYKEGRRGYSGCLWNVLDGKIWVEFPKGEAFHGIVNIDNYQPVVLDQSSAGKYDIQLLEFIHAKVVFTNYSSLPNDAKLSVTLRGIPPFRSAQLAKDPANPESWTAQIGGPGDYVLWVGRSLGGSVRPVSIPVTFTEKSINESSATQVDLPLELFHQFTDDH
jgi:hypothetical protein